MSDVAAGLLEHADLIDARGDDYDSDIRKAAS